MYFLALATDYDGTIAHHGRVDADTVRGLRSFRESGRRLILVTGRELPDLKRVCSDLDVFDRIVAENGALLFDPATEEERVLAPAPPQLFVQRLQERNVAPLSVGRSIVATWEPHQTTVLEVIRELGLELNIIFNKGAVMVLPSGMNKAAGLAAALDELGLSFHNVVGVGDAENDHAFLASCGCSAAVANSVPMVKAAADIALENHHGAGVVELMRLIDRADAAIVPPERNGILLGVDAAGHEVYLQSHRGGVLIAGTSGIGKSTLATALTERMAEKRFEFCVFDPEGDYIQLENAVTVGDAKTAPSLTEALDLLRKLAANVVVNTQGLGLNERPPFFLKLIPHIAVLRAQTGRPHWLLIDEAHHLLPSPRDDVAQVLPEDIPAAILITVHPERVSAEVLETVAAVIALGPAAAEAIAAFCRAVGISAPESAPKPGEAEVLFWAPESGERPRTVKVERPRQLHKRHTQKYAQGDLGEDRSFYFRGPHDALNLRAQNLMLFLQIAQGVDDPTWEHHLRKGDYSGWFRQAIKNDDLAKEVEAIEADRSLDATESRLRVRDAVTRRYAMPASAPHGG